MSNSATQRMERYIDGEDEKKSRCGPLEQMNNILILMVNKSFLAYNRPWLLAILVGVSTLVMFFTMTFIMLNNCATTSFTGTPTALGIGIENGDLPGCINSMYKLVDGSNMEPCLFAPAVADTFASTSPPYDVEKLRTRINQMKQSDVSSICQLDANGNEIHDGTGQCVEIASAFKRDWDPALAAIDYVVPNYDSRPELMALRKGSNYCAGSDIKEMVFGKKESGGSLKDYVWFSKENDYPMSVNGEAQGRMNYKLIYNEFSPWCNQCEIVCHSDAVVFVDGDELYQSDTNFGAQRALDSVYVPKIGVADKEYEAALKNKKVEYNRQFKQEHIEISNADDHLLRLMKWSGEIGVKETMVTANFKLCPDKLTTIGAAFGWTTLIELLLSLFFIVLLHSFGCIKREGGLKAGVMGAFSNYARKESDEDDMEKGKGKRSPEIQAADVGSKVVELSGNFGL